MPIEKSLAEIAEVARITLGTMFENPFASFPGQVKARKICVLGLKFIDDPEGLQVMFESAEVLHTLI